MRNVNTMRPRDMLYVACDGQPFNLSFSGTKLYLFYFNRFVVSKTDSIIYIYI